jgi:hypothetical protein
MSAFRGKADIEISGRAVAVRPFFSAFQLEPLRPEEISVVASGGSHPGILVSFLGDLRRMLVTLGRQQLRQLGDVCFWYKTDIR